MAQNSDPQSGDVFEACARFVRHLGLVLYRCRMSVLGAILAAIFIAWPDQSIELFRIYLEDLQGNWAQLAADPLAWAFFLLDAVALPVAALAATISLWYWGRFSLYVFLPQAFELDRDEVPASLRFFARTLPRLCGVAVPVALGIAFYRSQHPDYWIPVAVCGAAALLCLIWWTRRRARLDRRTAYRVPAPRTPRGFARLSGFGGATWAMLLLSLASAAIGIWAFGFADIAIALAVGAAPLVLLWVALIVPVASILAWAGKTMRVPILSAMLVAAAVFGFLGWSSNNEIRFADRLTPNARTAPPDAETLNLQQSFDAWLAARRDRADYAGAPYPVVFVAAQGGGIRAAYLTARVLAAIQDRCPRFAHHVFAISGVSGGSLGGATFAALTATAQRVGQLDPAPAAACERFDAAASAPPWFLPRSDAVLRQDFLAPSIARLITSDLLGAFIPYRRLGWSVEDRGHALERAFERAWWRTMQATGLSDDLFAQRMGALWVERGFATGSVPALLLNSTNVETGTQTVVSPFDLCVEPFNGMWSLHAVNPRPIPLSVATSLSARFPLVTSSGAVPVLIANREATTLCAPDSLNLSPGDRDARFVDGGYYENSGASTLFPLILAARHPWPRGAARTDAGPFRPIVLLIENAEARTAAPLPGASARRSAASGVSREPATSLGRFSDAWWEVVMDPIRALLNARETRGYVESARLELLRNLVDSGVPNSGLEVVTVRIDRDDQQVNVPIPLGWALSQKARCELDRLGVAANPACGGATPDRRNSAALNRLVDLLRPGPPRPTQ